MPKIAIVILHFANKKQTQDCLNSVNKLEAKGFEIEVIVVNNRIGEDLSDLEEKFKQCLFLKTGQNLGYAGGNNFGIKKALKAKADFIFLLNNDTILDKKILVELIKVASLNKKSGLLGPKIYFAPGYEFHKERYQKEERGKVFWYAGGLLDWRNMIASHRGVDEVDFGQYDLSTPTDFVSGCAMFIKKEVFEKIGFFDERYFLYLEDVDFCQRAKRAGFDLLYVPQAKLWHVNAGSSQVGGPLHDYFLTRNRLLFGMEYATLKTKLALLRESLKILFHGSSWQKIGVRDFYLRKFGQGSFPTFKMIK